MHSLNSPDYGQPRHLDVIPFLPQEGITCFLLTTFLPPFGEALVLANCHGDLPAVYAPA